MCGEYKKGIAGIKLGLSFLFTEVCIIIQKWTGFTRAGAQKVIDRFIDLGILTPRNKDKKYDQSYEYKRYIKIFY
jgi:hypothetical protein